MTTYMLREGVAYAIVPGHGKLYPGQTISGNYAMLVPGTLREVVVPVTVVTPEVATPVATEVVPVTVVTPEVGPPMATEVVPLSDTSEPINDEDAVGTVETPPTLTLPPPDTMPQATTSGTVAVPQPPKSGKGSRR